MHICCVCTGNTCRSPMLAALLRQELAALGRNDVRISSAGIAAAPGAPASEHSVAAMRSLGIDISAHRSTPATELDLAAVDHFLCLSGSHAMALIQAGVRTEAVSIVDAAAGGVPDPYGGSPEAYTACATVLAREARRIANQLCDDEPPAEA
ncbi:MAG: low molecular weight phosphatase family protein [Planctomycetota bacterium]